MACGALCLSLPAGASPAMLGRQTSVALVSSHIPAPPASCGTCCLAERPIGFPPEAGRQRRLSQTLRLPMVSGTQRPVAARHALPSPAAGSRCGKNHRNRSSFPPEFCHPKNCLNTQTIFLFILLKNIVILSYRQNAARFFPHRFVQKAHQRAVFSRRSPNAALTSHAKRAFVQTTAACRQWVLLG